MTKKAITTIYEELYNKGEILKAKVLLDECIPLDLENDPDIIALKNDISKHLKEIKSWEKGGRPYPGVHATVEFNKFPKFVLAKEKILAIKDRVESILDCGCYSGDFLRGMNDLGFKCCGIDVHRELIRLLIGDDGYNGISFRSYSMTKILFDDNKFDVVTAFDVLEHVLDLKKAIKEMERVCKSGGLIIINLPRMTIGYEDKSGEHLRMFSDKDINKIWGKRKNFKFEFCKDEYDSPTSFITYTNG